MRRLGRALGGPRKRTHGLISPAQGELVAALSADVDRQLTAAEHASAGMATRASILIAAAGVTSGLQVSADLGVPAILAVAAALVGVSLMLMRTAEEVPILEAEETFWAQSPVTAKRNLMHWKNRVLLANERSLRKRRVVLVAGFALLASSISWQLVIGIVNVLNGGGE